MHVICFVNLPWSATARLRKVSLQLPYLSVFPLTKRVFRDALNSDSVCNGLWKLRQKSPNEWIYVVLDNAAYQRCKKVKSCVAELNINLIFLPPYSPNLNLIERLWKFLRRKVMSNKYYTSFQCFFDSIKTFLDNAYITFASSLDTLLAFNFECLDASKCIN